MQFNTVYLGQLRKYGITAQDVAQGGCYSYDLAAWRLRGHLRNDQGDIWTRAANYHSRTPQYNAVYRASLRKRAAKWEKWLVARFPTFDVTQPGEPVVAGVAAEDATPRTGQSATTAPATPKPAVAVPAQPVQIVKTSVPVRHYNVAAAAALAAVFATATHEQGGANETAALAREP
jgi:hypothetical protein